MYCANFIAVEDWIRHLNSNNITIRRYNNIDIDRIMKFSAEDVMMKHLKDWLSTGDYVTFWHLKQLLINLKNTDVLLPVVGTLSNNRLLIDPGGSRLTALKYLNKKSVAVDIVYPVEDLQQLQLGDYKEIIEPLEFVKPYEEMKTYYRMDMCYDQPCDTCKNNRVIHNGDYRYSITWHEHWYYEENYFDWYEKNKNFKTENLLDWYHI